MSSHQPNDEGLFVLGQFERTLAVQLGDAECAEAASKAAELQASSDKVARESAAALENAYRLGAEAQARIEKLDAERRVLLRAVRLRRRSQLVPCERRLLIGPRLVQTTRCDTGEVLEEYAAQESELRAYPDTFPPTAQGPEDQAD